MVNKRDVKVFIVCLSYHFDVGLFHIIGHGGTPLAVLDDTHIFRAEPTVVLNVLAAQGPKILGAPKVCIGLLHIYKNKKISR
jgi:hypothetical protein